MRITRQNSAGLVVDIQERLFPVMWEKEKLLTNCLLLIRGLHALNLPVVVTQQYTRGLGETIPEIQSALPEFSYIEKRDFSCGDEPAVVSKLEDTGVKHVIICGIESHVCVLQTAIDLKEKGFIPVVVADCISSRKPESLELAMERFRYENIIVTSAESILFELTRTSTAPEFKAISNLVKQS